MDARGEPEEGLIAGSANRERFAAAAREDAPDVVLLCLLVALEAARPAARESGHAAVVDGALGELDRLSSLLPHAPGRTPQEWAHELEHLLGVTEGFHGMPEDYRRLESSLLPRVLLRRRGLPILLSVVWTEVARRAGAPAYGVALPGHFTVGLGDPDGDQVLVDPFGGGRLLTPQDAALLTEGRAGVPDAVTPAMLRPAGARETVLRVLTNIRAWAAARPEQSAVQLWALELSLLLPHRPVHLHYERARLLVERADFEGGARAMEAYAERIGAMKPDAAETALRAARTARSRLN